MQRPMTQSDCERLNHKEMIRSELESLGKLVGRGRSKVVQAMLPELNYCFRPFFDIHPGAWQLWYEEEFLPDLKRIVDLIADDPPHLDEEIDDYKRKVEVIIATKFMEKFSFWLLEQEEEDADQQELSRLRVKLRRLGFLAEEDE